MWKAVLLSLGFASVTTYVGYTFAKDISYPGMVFQDLASLFKFLVLNADEDFSLISGKWEPLFAFLFYFLTAFILCKLWPEILSELRRIAGRR